MFPCLDGILQLLSGCCFQSADLTLVSVQVSPVCVQARVKTGVSNIVENFWQLGRRCNDRHLYPPNSGVGKKEKFSINMVFSHKDIETV